MDDMTVEERRSDLLISTDLGRLDVDAVLAMLRSARRDTEFALGVGP